MRQSSSKISPTLNSRASRQKTHRLSEGVAMELDVHVAVRRLDSELNSQRAIIESALRAWFKNNPLPKEVRAAAELLIVRQGGGRWASK